VPAFSGLDVLFFLAITAVVVLLAGYIVVRILKGATRPK